MLQLNLATAAALCFGNRTSHSDVGRPESTPADRARCGIDMPRNFRIEIAGAAVSGLASIILGCAPAHAHDWYPLECCARNECMPARAVEGDGRGGMTVIVGDLRIGIPEGFAPRPSLDSGIHVCFRTYPNEIDGSITITPICLFLPARV